MKKDFKDDVALFRYALLAPLITGKALVEFNSKAQFFKHASKQTYTYYNGEVITIAASTIKKWYQDYTKGGIDALRPMVRNDSGYSRKIDHDISERIQYYKEQYPRIPCTIIHEKLLEDNIIKVGELSLSTITRYVKKLNVEKQTFSGKAYKRYEKEDINEVWYGDTSHGPYITHEGKRVKSYIIALIDDASRMIVGVDVFLNDNTVNLMSVMKTAVSMYGKPKMFSFDNGSNYKNKQMELVVARLASVLNHTQPYTPQSKGKIERWFRTLKDTCTSQIRKEDNLSLEQLRLGIQKYVIQYNNSFHSSLNKKSPQQRFFEQSSLIERIDNQILDESFLFEVERKVSNDGIINLDNKHYEVDSRYTNQKLKIRYSHDIENVYIVNDDYTLTPISVVNKIDNSKIKRKKLSLSNEED